MEVETMGVKDFALECCRMWQKREELEDISSEGVERRERIYEEP